MTWTFSPYHPSAWGTACAPGRGQRVLLVGSEPNGENPRGEPDMGDWFRRAHADHRRLGNPRFYARSLRQLDLARTALGVTPPRGGGLDDLRYVDLKATAGGSKCDERAVSAWVTTHLAEVLRVWLPLPGDPAAPHLTVLQGTPAQKVFVDVVLPHLLERGLTTRFVGMAHPASLTSDSLLDDDAVIASMRTLVEGFGAWRYRERRWVWTELSHPRWSAGRRVDMPGRDVPAFVATGQDSRPARTPFVSVDGSVPGAAVTWDHHVTGERINLDAMPPRLEPRRWAAIGTTLADTDALASVVAFRAGGEAKLPPEVALVLRAASERCDHLIARKGTPPVLQSAADALHRYVEQRLLGTPAGEVSSTFARLCDEVSNALARGESLPAAGVDPHGPGLQRRLLREGRVLAGTRVAAIDLRGHPALPADLLHGLHAAQVAVIARDHPAGGTAYTVGVNPAVAEPDLDLREALRVLAVLEHARGTPCLDAVPRPGSENWGGRTTVFGSPWNYGSRLSLAEVVAVVASSVAASVPCAD